MRAEHKNSEGGLSEKGREYFNKKDGSNLKIPLNKGTNSRRISFAARFSGMQGGLKDDKGNPTRLALALKKWGFRNKESARNFANKHKKKPTRTA
jgi:hypothetical protein